MKVVASVALHYGISYLNHAIRSIIDDVDEVIVLYSAIGSHGHRTDAICPDTREDLLAIAERAAGDKLRWFDGVWSYEGQQRDSIFEIAPDADAIVVLDSDEIWPPGLANAAIEHGLKEHARQVRVSLTHYWRSFYKGFTHDPAAPARVHLPKIESGETTYAADHIQHYGYAILPDLMRYKWLIHGHKGELRRDVGWLNDVYLANRQYDCHPVGSDYWQVVEDITPPAFMMDHPFAGLEVIE